MSVDLVQYEISDQVAIITMDDGKANAISHAMISALNGALDRASEEAKAIVLAGRPGKFCAGFDLGVMRSGPEAVGALLTEGTNLLLRIYEFPMPVVMAATGHAIAGGVLLLATGDTRIGIDGPFKLGLNEVSNGMPVPIFAHRLAQDRLDPREFVASVLQAKIYDPQSACTAGWLDRVVSPEELKAEAVAEATRLAELPKRAYAMTKASFRKQSIEYMRTTLGEDLKALAI